MINHCVIFWQTIKRRFVVIRIIVPDFVKSLRYSETVKYS